ncbi:TniQ family protein [Streptomyces sp. NPDC020799]|uniref:TniQ family protein n=1 Tax=Streptomyces sp. NPDC020799 TaxID=3365091 RepID=UPI0037A5228B
MNGRMRPRRTVWVPLPHPGESLVSWTDRTGAALGLPRARAAEALGLELPTGNPGLSLQNLTRWISDEAAARVHAATGVPAEEVIALTVRRFQRTALSLDEPFGTKKEPPGGFRMLSKQHAYRYLSLYCPQCLGEGRGWQLAWCLPWSVVCLRHRRYLHIDCPNCGTPLDHRHGTLAPALCTGWVSTGSKPVPGRPGASRPAHRRCRKDLSRVPATRVHDQRMLAAQQYVYSLLTAPEADSGGARQKLLEMRLLVIFATRLATVEHLGPADRAVIRRFGAFTAVRKSHPNPALRMVMARRPWETRIHAAAILIAHQIAVSGDPHAVLRSMLPPPTRLAPSTDELAATFQDADWEHVASTFEPATLEALNAVERKAQGHAGWRWSPAP